jgi:multiple sugar transport system substrate-binding protein
VVTITFGVQSTSRGRYEPLVEKFHAENPAVRVQIVDLDAAMEKSREDTALAIREMVSLADTLITYYTLPQDPQSRNYYYELTPLMEADPTFDRSDFFPNALESYTAPDGALYELPTTLNVSVLSFNKDLFAQHAVPEPRADWTWADMRRAAEALGGKPTPEGSTYGLMQGTGMALQHEMAAAGIDLSLSEANQPPLDDPRVLKAVEQVGELVRSQAIYEEFDRSYQLNELARLIAAGRVGMWDARRLPREGGFERADVTPPTFAIGTVAYPAFTGLGAAGYTSFAISAGTKHPEAAWQWLAFLTRQDFAADSHLGDSVALPARRSVAAQNRSIENLPPQIAEAVRATLDRPQTAGSTTTFPYWYLYDAVNAAAQGDDPAPLIAEAKTRLADERAAAATTPTPAPPIVVATPLPAAPAAGEATRITFGVYGWFEGQTALRQAAQRFNEQNSGVFVDVKTPDADGMVKLADAAAANDCFGWYGPPTARYQTLDAVLDLQPLIDADPSFDLKDYPAALLAPYRVDGRLNGLPYQVNLMLLGYNRKLFDAAGLAYPQPSWTLDEFIATAQQLTTGEGDQRQYGFATAFGQGIDLYLVVAAAGGRITTGSGTSFRPNYTDPRVAEGVRAYIELARAATPHQRLEGYAKGSDFPNNFPLFESGRVAMWFGDSGSPTGGTPSGDVGFAPLPLGTNPFPWAPGGNGMFISAQTPHADACWQWLKQLSNDVSALGSNFPARTSVATSPAFAQAAPAGAAAIYAASRAALETPASLPEFDVRDFDDFWFSRAVDRAMQGADLDKELADAQFLTTQFLACVRGGEKPATCARQVDPQYKGVLE